MWPLLFSALLISIAFAEQPPGSISYTHDVRMNATFDFIIRIPATASFSSSDSGFVECASITDCEPPNMHVQFFPRRCSLQIYGEPKDGNAKLTIIPFKRQIPNHIICIVGTGGHNLPPSCSSSMAAIIDNGPYTETVTLVFDENIKKITLEGPITKYEGGIRTGNAEVFVVYEPIDALDYKLMRLTGRIEMTPLSFSLKDPEEVETTYFLQPVANMENKYNSFVYVRFPK